MAVQLTRDLAAAQDAYVKGNTEKLRLSHSTPLSLSASGGSLPEPAHKSKTVKDKMNKYGKGLIFGGTYSLVLLSIFGSIVRASEFSYAVFIGFGVVCVISCGFFIAVSDFLGSSSDRELIQWERQRESWEYDNFLEGEQREMVELLEGKGVKHDDAELVIGKLSKYKEAFVDMMMIEELGLMAPPWSPLQHSLAVFVSFITGGTLLLCPAVSFVYINGGNPQLPLSSFVYWQTISLAACSIFPLGCLRSYFMEGNKWWRPGVVELANLLLASILAFGLASYVRPYIS